MTEKEFVTWFKGFAAAANTYNITPKQWDIICENLEKVESSKSLKLYTSNINIDNSHSNWTSKIKTENNESK